MNPAHETVADSSTLLEALDRAARDLDRDVPAALWRKALTGPAAEFLARPGKELRSAIVRAGWLLAGGDPHGPYDRVALVLELLHAGSLIVDDVEDGSAERRGRPALHHLVGVPLAINTGSWMYFWALGELAQLGLSPASQLLAQRATISALIRCHQGQALDLAVRISDVAVHDAYGVVLATTRLKTGALCRLAAELAAIAAGAQPARRAAIADFGEAMGIALQMLDDLGAVASPERRAKGREDVLGGRPTWPWAWLAVERPFAWARRVEEARLASAGGDADALLAGLAAEIGQVGRERAHAMVADALAALRAEVGPCAAITELADQLARMEKSYG